MNKDELLKQSTEDARDFVECDDLRSIASSISESEDDQLTESCGADVEKSAVLDTGATSSSSCETEGDASIPEPSADHVESHIALTLREAAHKLEVPEESSGPVSAGRQLEDASGVAPTLAELNAALIDSKIAARLDRVIMHEKRLESSRRNAAKKKFNYQKEYLARMNEDIIRLTKNGSLTPSESAEFSKLALGVESAMKTSRSAIVEKNALEEELADINLESMERRFRAAAKCEVAAEVACRTAEMLQLKIRKADLEQTNEIDHQGAKNHSEGVSSCYLPSNTFSKDPPLWMQAVMGFVLCASVLIVTIM